MSSAKVVSNSAGQTDFSTPQRYSIVVIDDNERLLKTYRSLLESYFGNRVSENLYLFHFFSNSAEATEFVSRHGPQILGYIQDINRSDSILGDGSRDGISFFNNVIDSATPWAKCLVISAVADISDVAKFLRSNNSKIRFIPKADLSPGHILNRELEWLITPFEDSSQSLPPTAARAVTLITPAWNEICRYIVSHENYLHTMDTRSFEELAGEIYRSFGWDVELTSRTRDGGYDIMAMRQIGPSSLRVLVEAKRFNPERSVGVGLIRSLYGVKQSKAASQLVLVTSSFVTADAKREFSRVVPWELDFFERDRVLEWCRRRSSVKTFGDFD